MAEYSLPHNHGEEKTITEIRQQLEKNEQFTVTAEVFKLLGDATRLKIFWILCHCEECVLNIASLMQMSPPAVSHHLRILKEGNLISSRREGKEVYYKAADTTQSYTLHIMIEKIIEITCPRD
jgi:DNA-binding transcriptional ArsR family regulator